MFGNAEQTTSPSSSHEMVDIALDSNSDAGNNNEHNGHDHDLSDMHGITIGHKHYSHRSPSLRAAVLGANDGLVSISAILMGVIAGNTSDRFLLLTSVSAILGGSISMAVGEYVSVSTQRDSERADIQKEIDEHSKGPEYVKRELDELTNIYIKRGLNRILARQVAVELSKGDVIRVHMQDELGIDIDNLSSPSKASFYSGISFLFGSVIPLCALFVKNQMARILTIIAIDIVLFILFGYISAKLGGAPKLLPCIRIILGGLFALGITYAAGYLFSII